MNSAQDFFKSAAMSFFKKTLFPVLIGPAAASFRFPSRSGNLLPSYMKHNFETDQTVGEKNAKKKFKKATKRVFR